MSATTVDDLTRYFFNVDENDHPDPDKLNTTNVTSWVYSVLPNVEASDRFAGDLVRPSVVVETRHETIAFDCMDPEAKHGGASISEILDWIKQERMGKYMDYYCKILINFYTETCVGSLKDWGYNSDILRCAILIQHQIASHAQYHKTVLIGDVMRRDEDRTRLEALRFHHDNVVVPARTTKPKTILRPEMNSFKNAVVCSTHGSSCKDRPLIATFLMLTNVCGVCDKTVPGNVIGLSIHLVTEHMILFRDYARVFALLLIEIVAKSTYSYLLNHSCSFVTCNTFDLVQYGYVFQPEAQLRFMYDKIRRDFFVEDTHENLTMIYALLWRIYVFDEKSMRSIERCYLANDVDSLFLFDEYVRLCGVECPRNELDKRRDNLKQCDRIYWEKRSRENKEPTNLSDYDFLLF